MILTSIKYKITDRAVNYSRVFGATYGGTLISWAVHNRVIVNVVDPLLPRWELTGLFSRAIYDYSNMEAGSHVPELHY